MAYGETTVPLHAHGSNTLAIVVWYGTRSKTRLAIASPLNAVGMICPSTSHSFALLSRSISRRHLVAIFFSHEILRCADLQRTDRSVHSLMWVWVCVRVCHNLFHFNAVSVGFDEYWCLCSRYSPKHREAKQNNTHWDTENMFKWEQRTEKRMTCAYGWVRMVARGAISTIWFLQKQKRTHLRNRNLCRAQKTKSHTHTHLPMSSSVENGK